MRKVLGAARVSLALTFLGESIVLAFLATALGVILVALLVPMTPIGDLFGTPLALNDLDQPTLIGVMLGLTLGIGLAAGLYPAVSLSSIAPLAAFKGSGAPGSRGRRLREVLVLVQFTTSVCVIACTLLMGLQMRFLADRSLGFEKEHRVLITLRGQDLIDRLPALEDELATNTGILGVSNSASMMGREFGANSARIASNTGEMQVVQVSHMAVADNFVGVMGMDLVAGRDFSRDRSGDDTRALIVNEALVAYMGWEDPLGKTIKTSWGGEGSVIGVVKDFNFKSLHTTVEPFVMYQPAFLGAIEVESRPFQERLLVVNIAGEKTGDTLDAIRRTVARFDPAHPVEYRFLDATLDQLYLSDQRLMRLIGLFSGICIFIACLGLFGLAAFTTEQRTKEIGIRKVLGASTMQIIRLLAGKIVVLVLAGAVLASGIAYLAMDAWLSDFAYRTPIHPLVFVAAAAVAVTVAYATMAVQSLRVARAQPVHTLRHE
jgi:putative ABC transport system permease protein